MQGKAVYPSLDTAWVPGWELCSTRLPLGSCIQLNSAPLHVGLDVPNIHLFVVDLEIEIMFKLLKSFKISACVNAPL